MIIALMCGMIEHPITRKYELCSEFQAFPGRCERGKLPKGFYLQRLFMRLANSWRDFRLCGRRLVTGLLGCIMDSG